MDEKKSALHRRVLAKLAAVVGIVAIAKPAAAMKPKGDKAGPHYRETEHVKTFYRVNKY